MAVGLREAQKKLLTERKIYSKYLFQKLLTQKGKWGPSKSEGRKKLEN